jgi:hypothetical protein
VPEAHTGSDLDELCVFCRGDRALFDTEPVSCAPDVIEAGVRVGRPDEAAAALDRLSERTQASGTNWGLGIEAGSRALLSNGRHAEALYREAVERLERSRGVVHLARARLRYGEWLRRENRRVGAVPPAQGLPEAGHHLAEPARPASRRQSHPCAADVDVPAGQQAD